MKDFDYLTFAITAFASFAFFAGAFALIGFELWRFIETRKKKISNVDGFACGGSGCAASTGGTSRPADGDTTGVMWGESGAGIKCYGVGEFPLQRATALADGIDLGGKRVQCAGCEQCRCDRSNASDAA